jgi:membrane-bound ClpP family serine protease
MRTQRRPQALRTTLRAWAAIARTASALALVLLGVLSTAHAADPPASPAAASTTAPKTVQPVPGGISAQNLAVITISGPIDGVTARSFERRIARAVEGGADAIVIELDTPGGEGFATLGICQAIETCPVHTIAWVNTNAISAGAIIALSCREIVIADGAILGDAGPVNMLNPNASSDYITDPLLQEKMVAPLLAQIVDAARRNGHDEALVQGFIFPGVETWLVEENQTGRRFFLTESEYRALFGAEPERTSSMVASGPDSQQKWDTTVDTSQWPAPDATSLRPASGLLNPSIAEAVNTALGGGAASTRPDFSKEDPANFRVIGYATDGQTLLTLKGGLLRTFGFVKHPADINTDADMKAYVGATHLVRLDQTWIETAVGFMTQGFSGLIIRGVLIVVFLLSMFIELSMPGVGLPGVIALCALALLVVPSMLLGGSVWWAVGAIVGGVGLLLLEILVFPGFGIPGLLGMVLMLGGLVGTFMTGGALFPGAGTSSGTQLFWAVSTVLLAVFTAGAAMFFLSKYTRSVPIANKLVLFASLANPAESDASAAQVAGSSTEAGAPVAVGATGATTTPLRPSGTAEFGDRLIDVVAEYGFIDAGRRVRVVSASAYRVSVEELDASSAPGERTS